MTWKSRLKGTAIAAYLGKPGQTARAAAAEVRRRIRREPVAVDFFHDPTDPWSHLAAQAAERLAAKYPDLTWRFHAVSPPASDVVASTGMRVDHGVRDAAELATVWDVDFPGTRAIDPTSARWIGSVLIRERPFASQVRAAIELGDAAWRNDDEALMAAVGRWGHEAHLAVAPGLAAGYERLRAAGHYQGGMFHYRGEWYWGIDRLRYLEAELAEDTGVTAGTGVVHARSPRPPERLASKDGPLPLEIWLSFRSPYSYLALERLPAAIAGLPVTPTLRFLLPMVERGVPAPSVKTLYIARDAAREAAAHGVRFGTIADPLGKGVERCLAIAHHASRRGDGGMAFAQSAMRGIWAEALDVASDDDLRTIVERTGMRWAEAEVALADDSWRAWANAAADDLAAVGLWGVPCFRVGSYVTWGQDRLDQVVSRVQRHVAALAEPAVAATP